MLESLIFVFIVISVGVSLILAFIFILIGFAKKSRKLKIISLQCGIIAVFFYALIPIWYKIIVPQFNKSQMEEFSGSYILKEPKNKMEQPHFILYPNGTYSFEGLSDLKLNKKGKWETGGIDGAFDFFSETGSLLKRGHPSGSHENTGISFDIFDKESSGNSKRIYFIKQTK